MTQNLHQLYAERAARAGQDEDLDRVLALVRERVEQRAHRRRNLLAAGGGIAAVATLVAAALVVPGDGSSNDAPAGGGVVTGGVSHAPSSFVRSNVLSSAPSSVVRSNVLPSGTPTWVPASDSTSVITVTLPPSGSSAALPTLGAGTATTLVPVSTPKADAVAIGRVPAGWRYTGHSGPVTFYGPDSSPLNDNPDFAGVIVVDVHERIKPDGPNTLPLAGRKGRYHSDSGVQIVSVIVDSTTEMDVQVPANAHITRSQDLSIANTLQLRSKAEKTHG